MSEVTPPADPQFLPQMPRRQSELALVGGVPFNELPADLYIPPDALEVILEAFEGPLDLLLYLIRRQNLDILEIKVADITEQYMQYIALMEELQFELASEYLVMAAMLAEIKSRMLLPRPESAEDEGDDPRAELIRRLQEYERFKNAAVAIDEMPRVNREVWIANAKAPENKRPKPLPDVEMKELLMALASVLRRVDQFASHHISLEPLSTRERMSQILFKVKNIGDQFLPFIDLFELSEGRRGVVVTFIAVLELIKESLLEIQQAAPFAPIHVKARAVSAIEPPPEVEEDE
ncbi:MAG: segregation and condensation protein A [Pseudomonadales bacterium]|jgi:segregation and condensation protein A